MTLDIFRHWLWTPGRIPGGRSVRVPGCPFRWLCLVLPGLMALLASAQPAPPGPAIVRIGISSQSVGNTNRADAIAAMKVWTQTVLNERSMKYSTTVEMFDSIGQLEAALLRGKIDLISVPADAFFILQKAFPISRLFSTVVRGKVTEQYVVLVNKDRAIQGLGELRGEPILILDHHRTAIMDKWLETELLRRKCGTIPQFFGKVTHVSKANQAILPVFFNRAAAAVVFRSAFETAGELNPQLQKEVRVLMSSPELIHTISGVRGGSDLQPVLDLLEQDATKLGETPSGRHILDLFQIDGVRMIDESHLSVTRSLLAEHTRLKAEAERRAAH